MNNGFANFRIIFSSTRLLFVFSHNIHIQHNINTGTAIRKNDYKVHGIIEFSKWEIVVGVIKYRVTHSDCDLVIRCFYSILLTKMPHGKYIYILRREGQIDFN